MTQAAPADPNGLANALQMHGPQMGGMAPQMGGAAPAAWPRPGGAPGAMPGAPPWGQGAGWPQMGGAPPQMQGAPGGGFNPGGPGGAPPQFSVFGHSAAGMAQPNAGAPDAAGGLFGLGGAALRNG
jgi:hypothetical protein